jgi:signal-transduction protein with cAMP-binding, CBS, and nucleotidyltransferase domain
MQVLVNSLRRTPIFSQLSTQQIKALINRCKIYTAASGTKIIAPENAVKHHLLILDGNIKSHNKWLFHGNEMQYCWQLQSDESLCRFAILSSATRAMNATAISNTRFLFINGDEVESLQTENNANTLNTELLKLAV